MASRGGPSLARPAATYNRYMLAGESGIMDRETREGRVTRMDGCDDGPRTVAALLILVFASGCAWYHPNQKPIVRHAPRVQQPAMPHQDELDRVVAAALSWARTNAAVLLLASNPGLDRLEKVAMKPFVKARNDQMCVVRFPAVIVFFRKGEVDTRGRLLRHRQAIAFNLGLEWVDGQWQRVNVRLLRYHLPESEPIVGRSISSETERTIAQAHLAGITNLFGPGSQTTLPTARWEPLGTGNPLP